MRVILFVPLWISALVGTQGQAYAPPAAAAERAVSEAWTAERLHDERRLSEAADAYSRAVTALTATYGETHERTLVALNNHAAALLEMNRMAEAEMVLRDTLDRRQRAGLEEDESLAVTWNNLGEALLATGRVTAAITMAEHALALKKRVLPPGHPEIAVSLTNLAEALRQNGELTRARKLFEEAATLWAAPARSGTGTAAMPLMPGYARTLNSLGLLHDAEGRSKDAERAFLEALESSAKTYGPRHEYTATLHFNLAGHYAQYRDWKSADEHCRRALNVYEIQPSHQDAKLGLVLTLHAQILDHLNGRKREAQAQRRRACEIMALH